MQKIVSRQCCNQTQTSTESFSKDRIQVIIQIFLYSICHRAQLWHWVDVTHSFSVFKKSIHYYWILSRSTFFGSLVFLQSKLQEYWIFEWNTSQVIAEHEIEDLGAFYLCTYLCKSLYNIILLWGYIEVLNKMFSHNWCCTGVRTAEGSLKLSAWTDDDLRVCMSFKTKISSDRNTASGNSMSILCLYGLYPKLIYFDNLTLFCKPDGRAIVELEPKTFGLQHHLYFSHLIENTWHWGYTSSVSCLIILYFLYLFVPATGIKLLIRL